MFELNRDSNGIVYINGRSGQSLNYYKKTVKAIKNSRAYKNGTCASSTLRVLKQAEAICCEYSKDSRFLKCLSSY